MGTVKANASSSWERTKGVLAGGGLVLAAGIIASTGPLDPSVLGTSALFGGIGGISAWVSLRA